VSGSEPGLARLPARRRREALSRAKTVNGVSAMSAPETSGVESQYGIGCHADSSIRSSDPLVLPSSDREPDVEFGGRRDHRLRVERAVGPHRQLPGGARVPHPADGLGQEALRASGGARGPAAQPAHQHLPGLRKSRAAGDSRGPWCSRTPRPAWPDHHLRAVERRPRRPLTHHPWLPDLRQRLAGVVAVPARRRAQIVEDHALLGLARHPCTGSRSPCSRAAAGSSSVPPPRGLPGPEPRPGRRALRAHPRVSQRPTLRAHFW
jgi:hypothetical protein